MPALNREVSSPMLKRIVVAVVVAGLSVLTVTGQFPLEDKKSSLPDFDIRESLRPGSPAIPAIPVSSDEARLGARIVLNANGLTKLYLRDGRSLTGPSSGASADIAKEFLRARSSLFALSLPEIENLRLIVDDVTEKARFVSFSQSVNGVDVFNGQIKFTLSKEGELIQVAAGDLVPGLSLSTAPQLNPETAVKAAFAAINTGLSGELVRVSNPQETIAFANPRGGTYSPITAELSIFPMSASSARLAYRIFLEADSRSWYELLVDAATGELLFRHNLYVSAAVGRVFTESPSFGDRKVLTFPDGWFPAGGTVTTGNNVDAYLDADGNDQPDNITDPNLKSGRAFSSTQTFDFPFGDGLTGNNPRAFQAAAITNLFYFINTAHDYFYGLGFNEAAGNFQTDNSGKGGTGGDAVAAEAQYGGFTNNAQFGPTPEGVAPKIRMGIFTRGTSTFIDDLDSDYAGEVIVHEYTHGVSNRLVGAKVATSCLAKIQSGALGEGWSDYFAISFFNNPVHGVYLTQNSTRGIRRYSYEGYPLTYEDIGTGVSGYEVHDDGEIWAGTLWDLRKSLGQTLTDQLVLDGLKATPCNPSMTDARDAILSADIADNKGANRKTIWTIFAKHGLGYSAVGVDGTTLTGTRYDAAYDLPPDLQTAPNPAITSNPLIVPTGNGDTYKYTVIASNPAGGVLNYVLTSGPSGMTTDSAGGVVNWRASFVGQRVKITVTDGKGGKVVHGYFLPVVTTLAAGTPLTVNGDVNTSGYGIINVPQGTPILQFTLRGGTGDADLFVTNPDGVENFSERIGSTETLSFPNPKAGQWQFEVYAFKAYSQVALAASVVTPPVLAPNTTLAGVSGVIGSETFYRVTIPPGANLLTVSTSDGTGDVDLFMRLGIPPVCQPLNVASVGCLRDQFSARNGNVETINIGTPAAGDWYIDMLGFADYSGVTLTIKTTFPPVTLTSGGAGRTTTPGTGANISTGYATASVDSGVAPFGTAVFSLSQNGVVVSEAGIPSSPPTQSARIFIDYRSAVASGNGTIDINTGLAMANPGTSSAALTFTLRGANGQTITTGHGNLSAGTHRAKFIHELKDIAPDFALPANFSTATLFGALEITSSQPVSVLALRLTVNQRGDTLLTSTSVADLSRSAGTSPIYFPQIADGGGYTTSLVLSNTTGSTETGTIAIFDDNGSALSVRPVGGSVASSFSYSIPASGFFVFQTDGSAATTRTGSAKVTPNSGTNSPVGAGVFSFSPGGVLVTESGVPAAAPTTLARLYIDKSAGHDTGIAIVNPSGTAGSVVLKAFRTDGITSAGSGPATVNLAPGGHKAAFAGELISGLAVGFTGVAELSSSTPFAALTLRSLTNARGDFLLTTFPVADATQQAPSPIVFPQIADGAGYSTQFIFISAAGAASVSVNFTGDDGAPLIIGRTP